MSERDMAIWPDRRILELFGIDVPIVLAPMAGPGTPELAVAVSHAGGLGSLPCGLLSVEEVREAVEKIRAATPRPLNLNFFCHAPPPFDDARESAWRARLAPYYREQRLDPDTSAPRSVRMPFDADFCGVVERCRPEVVSFHFGLPEPGLLERVKATGAKVVASATTVKEARWLEARGCDAIIAQGYEAGGHRGMFLSQDISRQVGTFALVPQVADAVSVPVIAAGAVADARGIVAALALGASAVQIGTAYLFCPEAKVSEAHRAALDSAADEDTMVTNVFTGRPARGIVNRLMREIGPMSPDAPAFPLAAGSLAPLAAGAAHRSDFVALWSGQAARLATPQSAGDLTRRLAAEALARLGPR
jgi:nitronate monooxygenase